VSNLYDTDILLWSEEQAERLRHVAANDRRNANSPDWVNIAKERPPGRAAEVRMGEKSTCSKNARPRCRVPLSLVP